MRHRNPRLCIPAMEIAKEEGCRRTEVRKPETAAGIRG
jgi:hypothetical protein